MKKLLVFLLSVSLLGLFIIIQTACETSVEGSVEGGGSWDSGSGSFKGDCKGKISLKITFSPKPTVFDEAILIDLIEGLDVVSNSITVIASVSTDTGFTKSASFVFNKNTTLRIAPYLTKAKSHGFTPANKAAVDAFIKEALDKSNKLTNANLVFNFSSAGKLLSAKSALTTQEIGLRLRFLPNETPTPILRSTVNIPIKIS